MHACTEPARCGRTPRGRMYVASLASGWRHAMRWGPNQSPVCGAGVWPTLADIMREREKGRRPTVI
eukprot:847399-Prymnesium_polylepis.1